METLPVHVLKLRALLYYRYRTLSVDDKILIDLRDFIWGSRKYLWPEEILRINAVYESVVHGRKLA